MNAARPHTLGERLHRVNRITLGAAVTIIALAITASSFALGLMALSDASRLQAKVLAESAIAPMMFQDRKAAGELLGPLRNIPHVLSATLYSPEHGVFAR